MRHKIATWMTAGLTACAVILTAPAQAHAEDQYGGVGNFYKSTSCTANGYLVGRLTNYDTQLWTDQQYHHSMNTVGSYVPLYVLYDGQRWPRSDAYGYGASGTIRDGYQSFRNMFGSHTVQFIWYSPINNAAATCTRTL